jgi:hypothetical protein
MIKKRGLKLSPRMKSAIDELKGMLLDRYPEATFEVERDPEESDGVDLVVTVDVEDIGDVLGVVIHRLVDMQVEEDLPIHVSPVQPLERVLELMRRPRGLPSMDIDLLMPLK